MRAPNAPAQFALAPSQTANTSIRVYKPATIIVTIPNYTTGGTGGELLRLRRLEPQGAALRPYAGGNLTINSLNGEPIIPGHLSTRSGALKEVNPGPSRYYVPSTTLTVPTGYPSVLSTTYTVSLGSVITTR